MSERLLRGIANLSDGVITLTLFAPSDAPVLLEADRDAEHRRRFDFPDDFVPSLQYSENVIARWERERVAGERFAFAVRSAADGELLGGCELRPLGDGAVNVSYWTYPRHRRRGVASRAVTLACEVAAAEFDFRILQIVTDPDNIPSRRIAARHGFEKVGEQDGRIRYTLEVRGSPRSPHGEMMLARTESDREMTDTAAGRHSEIQIHSAVPTFLVPDVGDAARWYAEHLEFRTGGTFPKSEPYAYASLHRDGAEIMLLRLAGYQKPDLARNRPGGSWDAYLRTRGVKALYERVRDHVLIQMPLKKQTHGDSEFEVKDPNGYVIVFGGSLD